MTIFLAGTMLGTAIIILGLIEAILELRNWRRRRTKTSAIPPASPIYEVGSPEYNAQIVDAIHTLNERLAPEGKRVPERVALDIIRQATRMTGEPDGEKGCPGQTGLSTFRSVSL